MIESFLCILVLLLALALLIIGFIFIPWVLAILSVIGYIFLIIYVIANREDDYEP